ncbi:MAG TPA: carboxylesterase family protein, partial [Kofleriaceae bacterium]|nr:carboxylesterase family protein [Kofleriaceae bacterium]
PVGELRWRPPAPALAWSGVRDASGFGSVCVQGGSSTEPTATAMGSEDCLTLNVWAPPHAGSLPVMVFVHGGYFTWGSSSYRRFGVDLYDGAHLAHAAGVIVVTLNYRVGPFGFLAHAALAAEDAHHSSGDYGLLDQLFALHWVQRNIAAFGGDPARVTLFGQSAGAVSTAALYASPLSRGLFAGAIMHSGNGEAVSTARAEGAGAELARRLHCETPDCMRAKSASQIATALPESFTNAGYAYGPVVDGYVLPARPQQLVDRGEGMHVPLIVATTTNEYSTMVRSVLQRPMLTPDDYQRSLADRFGLRLANKIVERYPAASFSSLLAAYTTVRSDAGFVCGSDWFADAASKHAPTYRFVYDHTMSAGPLVPLGAGHGLDLYFVFRNTPAKYVTLDDHERALSDALVGYWSRFAHAGDPNDRQTARWPARTSEGHEQFALDDQLHVTTPNETSRCDFWKPIIHDRP